MEVTRPCSEMPVHSRIWIWKCWSLRRGKNQYPKKNLFEKYREQTTNSTHIWHHISLLNPGQVGERRVLSTLLPAAEMRGLPFKWSWLSMQSTTQLKTTLYLTLCLWKHLHFECLDRLPPYAQILNIAKKKIKNVPAHSLPSLYLFPISATQREINMKWVAGQCQV